MRNEQKLFLKSRVGICLLAASLCAPSIAFADAQSSAQGVEQSSAKAVSELKPDDISGRTLYDKDGNAVANVSAVRSSADGRIEAVEIDVGGFLGIGRKQIFIPVNGLQLRNGRIEASTLTVDQIRNMPQSASNEAAQRADQLHQQASDAAQTAKDQTSRAAQNIKNKASDAKQAIGERVNQTGQQVSDAAQNLKDQAADTAQRAENKASDMKQAAGERAEEAGRQASNAAQTAKDKVADAAQRIENKASEIKQNIGEGINQARQTASSAAQSVKDKVTDAAQSVENRTNDARQQLSGGDLSRPTKAVSELKEQDVLGSTLYDRDRNAVANVMSVRAGANGAIEAIEIDVGGFLGLGAKRIAIPVNGLQFRDGRIDAPSLTVEQIRALPQSER